MVNFTSNTYTLKRKILNFTNKISKRLSKPERKSFRFHLTMDTFVSGYILPTTERIRGKRTILLINYLLTMIINIILIVSKILYRVNWYSLPDVNKKLYHKIIPSPCSTIYNTTLYYILFIQYQRILSYSSSPFFYLLKILHNLPP